MKGLQKNNADCQARVIFSLMVSCELLSSKCLLTTHCSQLTKLSL